MMKYHAVVFDLFGTLLQNIPAHSQKRERVLSEMARVLSVSSQDFIQLWNATFDQRVTGVFPSIEANIQHICGALGRIVNSNQIEEAVRIRFEYNSRSFQPRPDAVNVLVSLKESGFKIGLVSDSTPDVPILWQASPLSSHVDVAVFSCVVGVKKPDARIYRLVCKSLAVAPSECLYVGDHVFELKGAAQVGLHAVLLRIRDEDEYYSDREEWQGQVLEGLGDILRFVGHQ